MSVSWGVPYDFTEKSRVTMVAQYFHRCFKQFTNFAKSKQCLLQRKKEFKTWCVGQKKHSETECVEIANNGLWAFCDVVYGYGGCSGFNLKLVLPTTTTATTPTTTTTTTPTPKTTDTPFPVAHTIGGAAGGVLLTILVFVIIWFCRKKRNAMKSPAFANTTAAPTTTGTVAPSGFSTATGTRTKGTGTGTGKTRNTGYV